VLPVLPIHFDEQVLLAEIRNQRQHRQAEFKTGTVPAMPEHDLEFVTALPLGRPYLDSLNVTS
jgi:hypothetical protein